MKDLFGEYSPQIRKIKPIPPEKIWEKPSHLPYLKEARDYKPKLFTDNELTEAQKNKEQLVWDIESYLNYFLILFKSIQSGKSIEFECDKIGGFICDKDKLKWILENFELIDFNGNNYDIPIATIACRGVNTEKLNNYSKEIVEINTPGWLLLKNLKIKQLQINHIDLIQITKLAPGLKKLTGRLHGKIIMDLPFPPGTILTDEQKIIVKWYCYNDLTNTENLYRALEKQIDLRVNFGKQYDLDLRSKSDAQMTEAIFRAKLKSNLNNLEKVEVKPGYKFQYKIPNYIKFLTDLNWVLEQIRNTWFEIDQNGYVIIPKSIEDLEIPIGKSIYKMGIGGLHSKEESCHHICGDNYVIRDFDVASYYPKLILATGMYPPQLGISFITNYQAIVDQRLKAKAEKNTVVAEGLKIAVNGGFGKTLDPYSCLYYPELGMQTTLTGQLSLLMLIELLEYCCISVVSANTDGIITKFNKNEEVKVKQIVKNWQNETNLELESTDYKAIYNRDVNNYFAIKLDGKIKGKGIFGDTTLEKNPSNRICYEAVIKYLSENISIDKFIKECKDFTKFLTIREVRGGGGVKITEDKIEYLGKNVRWYYAENEQGKIVSANKGHTVPKSEGGKPCMILPDEFPQDINYDWYIEECYKLLTELGVNI